MILADTLLAEPWWVIVIKSVIIFGLGLTLIPIALMADRKVMGRMQNRYGPNRVGPFGALTPVADILKLLSKRQFRPRNAVGWMYTLAPLISIATAVAALAIIPFGDVVTIAGRDIGLYGLDVSIGPLYLFAFGSIAFYGLMLGGWSSGNKYAFLGAMRAAAQMISYEVSQGLALIGVIIMAGTMSFVEIADAQAGLWYIVPQFVGFIVFLVATFAETNRPPFDMVEADAELVAGYNTEYGGGRFAVYYFAEYLNVVVASGIIATVYLGGWQLPFVTTPGWAMPLVVLAKLVLVVLFFVWVRATLPRLRYDQVMSLGWKVLLPIAMLNTLVTAILVVAL
ncbi:MAG: NADH-quinone oxidoreductase subunit NuoH [Baekduia sp.]